jgi:hypothetical protein
LSCDPEGLSPNPFLDVRKESYDQTSFDLARAFDLTAIHYHDCWLQTCRTGGCAEVNAQGRGVILSSNNPCFISYIWRASRPIAELENLTIEDSELSVAFQDTGYFVGEFAPRQNISIVAESRLNCQTKGYQFPHERKFKFIAIM